MTVHLDGRPVDTCLDDGRHAARSVVARHEQRPGFRNARPRRHLHDLVHTEPEPVLARTWRRPSRSRRVQLPALGAEELELLARRAPSARRAPAAARAPAPAARRASGRAPPSAARAPPSHRAASPFAATSRRRRAARTARPCGRSGRARSGRASSVSSSARERAPQRQLVSDRLGELERLDDLARAVAGRARVRPFHLSLGPRRAGRPAPIVRPRRRPGARKLSDRFTPSSGSSAAVAAPAARARAAVARESRAAGRRRRPEPARAARRSRPRVRRTGAALRPHVESQPGPTAASARCSAASSPPYSRSTPRVSK